MPQIGDKNNYTECIKIPCQELSVELLTQIESAAYERMLESKVITPVIGQYYYVNTKTKEGFIECGVYNNEVIIALHINAPSQMVVDEFMELLKEDIEQIRFFNWYANNCNEDYRC